MYHVHTHLPEKNVLELVHRHAAALLPLGKRFVPIELDLPLRLEWPTEKSGKWNAEKDRIGRTWRPSGACIGRPVQQQDVRQGVTSKNTVPRTFCEQAEASRSKYEYCV